MKSTGLGIGFGTGISTLGQLQEATDNLIKYKPPIKEKPDEIPP